MKGKKTVCTFVQDMLPVKSTKMLKYLTKKLISSKFQN